MAASTLSSCKDLDDSFSQYLQDQAQNIHDVLSLLIPRNEGPCTGKLLEAARYSLLAPGKKLRPLMTLACCEDFNGRLDQAMIPAACIEMIHTYSLIHDDLPCMDDDDLRRGKPTLHKVYPEGHAVLAGNFLLTYAFECLSCAVELSEHQKIQLIHCLSQRIGAHGMLGGQAIDLAYEGKTPDIDTLLIMYERKTSDLFIAAIEFGAIVANASSTQKELLKEFASHFGILFQLQDDILDLKCEEKVLGKTSRSDLNNQKATPLSLIGIEETLKLAQKHQKIAQNALFQLDTPATRLKNLFKLITERSF